MSDESAQPPSKREVMLALLEHAEAQVHLDARREGVLLPPKLRGSSNVRLDYGYGLVPPIPDLSVGEDGIRATLSFNRAPFQTFVPWSAVFLIADFAGRGAVWREDLPPELIAHADAAERPAPEDGEPGPGDDGVPLVSQTQPDLPSARRLGVIDGDAAAYHPAADRDGDGEPEPPRPRPALRLVK
jgi:stringent starvation protein B